MGVSLVHVVHLSRRGAKKGGNRGLKPYPLNKVVWQLTLFVAWRLERSGREEMAQASFAESAIKIAPWAVSGQRKWLRFCW